MAVNIDTAHSVPGKWGTDGYGVTINGFTSGNMAGGILPTELSADWCDAVQMEITTATIQWAPFALDVTNYTDLGLALDYSHVQRRPTRQYTPTFTFRTQSDASLTGNGINNLVRERTQYTSAAAAGSATNAGILAIPSNTQAILEFRASVVQSDAISANYANIIYRASVRNAAGVVTIQDQAASYSHVPGIAYAFAVVVSGTNACFRITCPAVPAGKVHNLMVHSYMLNCTSTS